MQTSQKNVLAIYHVHIVIWLQTHCPQGVYLSYTPVRCCSAGPAHVSLTHRPEQVLQVDTREATIFMRVNREWCKRSQCCAAHTIVNTSALRHARPDGGPAPLPWTFHKVAVVRDVIKSGASKGGASVVFIDSDAFFVNKRCDTPSVTPCVCVDVCVCVRARVLVCVCVCA